MMNVKIEDFYKVYEVKSDFKKEFISLWKSWLGKENYHKLDEVTESDWVKFNDLVRLISKKYDLLLVNLESNSLQKIDDIEDNLSNYKDSMNKNSSEFSKYIIPDLNCILTEEWDYTYILWYKDIDAIKKLNPLLKKLDYLIFRDKNLFPAIRLQSSNAICIQSWKETNNNCS